MSHGASHYRWLPWIPGVLRALVGLVFLYAGATKTLDPATFADQIANYRLTPDWLTEIIAFYLPWFELILGLCLISHRFRVGSITLTCLLLIAFLAALISAWQRGLDIECGCFSIATGQSDLLISMIIDLALLSCLTVATFLDRQKVASNDVTTAITPLCDSNA